MANLLLYADEFPSTLSIVAGRYSVGLRERIKVDTWDKLAKEIVKYKKIDQLLLLFHGIPGGLTIDKSYKLDEKKVRDLFINATTKPEINVMPPGLQSPVAAAASEAVRTAATIASIKIEHIRFEGCLVAENPEKMVAFGRLFTTQYVSGYTWTRWSSEVDVKIPKGFTANSVSDYLRKYERWIATGNITFAQLAAQLASMAKARDVKRKLPMEWFQRDTQKIVPYEGNNYQQYKLSYKIRSEARNRLIKVEEAKPYDAPVTPFEYVTVKLL